MAARLKLLATWRVASVMLGVEVGNRHRDSTGVSWRQTYSERPDPPDNSIMLSSGGCGWPGVAVLAGVGPDGHRPTLLGRLAQKTEIGLKT